MLRRGRVLSITRVVTSRTAARRRATLVNMWRQWCAYSTAQRHRRRILQGSYCYCLLCSIRVNEIVHAVPVAETAVLLAAVVAAAVAAATDHKHW